MTRSPDGFLIVARASRGGSYNLPQSGGGGGLKQEKFILSRFWKPEVKNRGVGSRAVWGSRGRKHLAPHSQHPVAPGNPGCVWAMAAPSLQILPLPTRPASHPLSLFFFINFSSSLAPMGNKRTIHGGHGESETSEDLAPGTRGPFIPVL